MNSFEQLLIETVLAEKRRDRLPQSHRPVSGAALPTIVTLMRARIARAEKTHQHVDEVAPAA